VKRLVLWATVACAIVGCGGGGSGAATTPPVTPITAPTVSINSALVPGGLVQFSFTFSADVGTSFNAAGVGVTGGTKVAGTTRVDATHYTLNVTPSGGATTVTASIAVGAFSDRSGTPNQVAASTNQSVVDSAGVPLLLNGRNLAWHDEFATNGLPDSTKWAYETYRNSAGWYNNELQYYANARLQNSAVSNGVLSITARRESTAAFADSGGQAFTSARLITLGKYSFTYGFLQVRAKLPCSVGTWPAIWMLGTLTDNSGTTSNAWPAWGEIDLMEQTGFTSLDKQSVLGTVHTAVSGGAGTSVTTSLPDSCSAFHNYQLTWTSNSLQIGVDDVVYNTYNKPVNAGTNTWPFDQPQYLLLNLAMGGVLGGNVPSGYLSDSMQVQSVRVYQ
jgi:beta-glucanase (GH16 family)